MSNPFSQSDFTFIFSSNNFYHLIPFHFQTAFQKCHQQSPEADKTGSKKGHKWNWKSFSLSGGRKRKSRHISCPDITSASNDSSRSTSPVSFTLTSLFGAPTLPRNRRSLKMATQQKMNDFTDLRPVEYCQIPHYEHCFFVNSSEQQGSG